MKKFKLPKPIKRRTLLLKNAERRYHDALNAASDWHLLADEAGPKAKIRIETYHTKDIRWVLEEHWKWSATIKDMKLKMREKGDENTDFYKEEIARVRKIMRLIPKKGAWPYVSKWVGTAKELFAITIQPDGEISVSEHGDGWHRIIAHVELKIPTIEILYMV